MAETKVGASWGFLRLYIQKEVWWEGWLELRWGTVQGVPSKGD